MIVIWMIGELKWHLVSTRMHYLNWLMNGLFDWDWLFDGGIVWVIEWNKKEWRNDCDCLYIKYFSSSIKQCICPSLNSALMLNTVGHRKYAKNSNSLSKWRPTGVVCGDQTGVRQKLPSFHPWIIVHPDYDKVFVLCCVLQLFALYACSWLSITATCCSKYEHIWTHLTIRWALSLPSSWNSISWFIW